MSPDNQTDESILTSISCLTARSARLPKLLADPAASRAADASAGASSACRPTFEAAAAALRHARSTHYDTGGGVGG